MQINPKIYNPSCFFPEREYAPKHPVLYFQDPNPRGKKVKEENKAL